MEKRVYGVIGISSVMANWNADFSGFPKTTSGGETFGSDKALKYPMKKMWENEGKKVLYIKSMRLSKDGTALIPRTLKERYEMLFQVEDLAACKDVKQLLSNLMSAVDVKNFGATFAEANNNISITGAVQFGQGFNKYEGTYPEEQQILSPFRDAKDAKEEAGNSTLGTKIVSNEAHYFYPFVINPMAYKEFEELGVTEGYTEDDYQNFRRTALVSATSFATNSKEGCENEFALFVETDPDTYLPNLSEYIVFEKAQKKNVIRMECGDFLKEFGESVRKIDVYYNPYTTELEGVSEQMTVYDIRTQKEVG
ncbi:type I CRISPR-associated protein Cas7 [Mediterraneibacter glycyrrhizinilyticus]|nr:type I CRISPR-associated protein Cas7 [Mediterraneibacter glycyrrhizinilyticus]MBM6852731.1 type I CRISPR-associated protein Cas7 [Mediterraneibacter glycyrrhizinilyticus]